MRIVKESKHDPQCHPLVLVADWKVLFPVIERLEQVELLERLGPALALNVLNAAKRLNDWNVLNWPRY